MSEPTAPAPEATPAPAAEPAIRSRAEIARELFGKDFHEEPKETEEATPANTETGEEAPPVEEKPVEGEEPEAGGEETAPAEDVSETPIASWSELVEHNPWVSSLKVPVTVDGTQTEATIDDLVKSYQVTSAAEHRLELAKEYQAKQGEAWAAKQAGLDTHFQVLAELIRAEEANLEGDEKAVPPSLRNDDPAEWAARSQEFRERRNRIEKIKTDTINRYQALAQERAREGEVIRDQFRAEQAQLLLHSLPEWKDPEAANRDKAKIANYLIAKGFKPQELDNLLDHRQVLIARNAMLYEESRGQVETAKKRVATVPKIMRPGAPKAREQIASERIAALKAKMEKSGSMEDAFAYRMATKRGAR